jgi:hypothetical protein
MKKGKDSEIIKLKRNCQWFLQRPRLSLIKKVSNVLLGGNFRAKKGSSDSSEDSDHSTTNPVGLA